MRVKICGLTNLDDALVAVEAGADLVGFIFYPKSPRYVTPSQVRAMTDQIRGASTMPPLCVGVFVDVDWREVAQVLDDAGLDLAQLHGSEPPVEISLLAPRAFKALRPQSRGDAETLVATYTAVAPPTDPGAAAQPSFLIDAYHPWKFGGTGRRTDWHAAHTLAERFPILLAGSLTLDNVGEAISQVQPWGVDVSSGVESAPGQKDHALVREFIRAAKTAGK